MTLLAPSALPAFTDNYIWSLTNGTDAIVVDPGDASVVTQWLTEQGLNLAAILITHHHPDHVGGIHALLEKHTVPVYGPKRETIPHMSHPLSEGDTVQVPGFNLSFSVMDIPGHTAGHIGFYCEEQDWLFCGDTLFSAGCGRLFDGTIEQLYHSISRINTLPARTQVFCTHEYTLANLAFAHAVMPANVDVENHIEKVNALRNNDQPSLPTTLATERKINPFLRSDNADVQAACQANDASLAPLAEPMQCFAALRQWKDRF